MITEKGTVKTSVVHDEKMYNELNRSMHNLGILYIVCGAIIFALGVVMLGISIYEGTDDWNIILLAVGVIFVFLGIFFMLLCKNSAKAARKFKRLDEVEFFGDYLIEKGYTDGEHTSTVKLYYKWIVRVRETNNYLFLYNTRVTAVAVDKNGLPLDELNTIRSLLGRPVQPAPVQNVQPAQNEQPAQSAGESAATEVPPPDPFADMTDNKEE